MDAAYKNSLPVKAQSLVDTIEQFAGFPIQVIVDPSTAPKATDPNPERPMLRVTERSAAIFLPTPRFSAHGLTHELLHLQRYYLEEIPQVEPVDQSAADQWTVTSSIENTLEHQVIVPREADYGFDFRPYWVQTEKTLWAGYPWAWMTEPFARRKNCLVGFLTVENIAKDAELSAFVRECLATEGILKEAEQFRKRVTDVLHTKERAARLVVEFLQIPRSEVRLMRLDPRKYEKRYSPL